MNWFKSHNHIVRYHRTMIALHGMDSSLALGWREPQDQLLRFEVLAEIADLNNAIILDAGCGYADLYPFLKNRYPELKNYYGLEQVTDLLNRAKERYTGQPGVTLIEGDFIKMDLPVCDYILVSGSLNYGQDIQEIIPHLFKYCSKGLGFNLLKKVSGQGILKPYAPLQMKYYAETLSPRVILRNDYSDEDFTIFMFKDK